MLFKSTNRESFCIPMLEMVVVGMLKPFMREKGAFIVTDSLTTFRTCNEFRFKQEKFHEFNEFLQNSMDEVTPVKVIMWKEGLQTNCVVVSVKDKATIDGIYSSLNHAQIS